MTLDQILNAVKAKTIDLAEAEKLIASLKKTQPNQSTDSQIENDRGHAKNAPLSANINHAENQQPEAQKLAENTASINTGLSNEGLKSVNLSEVEETLRKTLAVTLFMEESEVSDDTGFTDMGLDSIVGVEWMRELNRIFNLDMPVTELYDHPTLKQLASHIASNVVADERTDTSALVNATPQENTSTPVSASREAPSSVASAETTQVTPVVAENANALVISTVHTLEEITLSAWQNPIPKANEVTVEVKASAINFPDAMCVNGLYPTMPQYPFVPGFEVAGVVTAVGGDVTEFSVGDAVIAITGEQMGGHASHVNVPADNTVLKPSNITFEEACSLPVAFGIVYHAFDIAQLSPHEKVLVQTATGGCGLLAIQLARLAGCEVLGTSSRAAKLDVLRRLNVEHRINYQNEAFDKRIAQLTQNHGVDVVLNMLSGEHIQAGLNCLAPQGRYLEIAVHALKTSPKLDLSRLVSNQSIHSIDLRRLSMDTGEGAKPHLEAMVALLKDELIVPILSRVYPFQRIGEAIQYVGQAQHIGKVVVSHTCDQMIDYTDMCIGRMLEQQHVAAKRTPSLYPQGFSSLVATSVKPTEATLQDKSVLSSPAQVEAVPHFASDVSQKASIAVLGMAGSFPKSSDIRAFWHNLEQGIDCVSEVTTDRWDNNQYYHPDPQAVGKTNCKWMGMLPDADKFDAAFFAISPNEAVAMDPQQRMVMQASWSCIEDAGINPDELSGSLCGIYIGVAPGDYGTNIQDEELSSQGLMGRSLSILSARTAFFLNLKGPCITLDTACSSSLVAIAEACNNLQLGTCDVALAGGVNVMATPNLHIMTSKAEMLSADGRCFTFDNRANGFVPCEGVGMLLLKTLSAAQRDGDLIKGVIRGWGINQDGKTNGITAPSTVSQTELEQRVYDRFDIDPRSIGLIETHGTGTKLGDPIEIRALKQAFAKYTQDSAFCALGSVKSSIGHGLASAGIAGSIKVLMALQHQTIPPLANFSQLNEHIELDNSPFYIPQQAQKWQPAIAGQPRRAAVSSFGFSGTNAHIVFEEAPQQHMVNDVLPVYPFVLSARTVEQLQAQANQLSDYVQQQPALDAGSVAYTLLIGRKLFKQRLVVLASSISHLQEKLKTAVSALAPFTSKEAKPKNNPQVQLASGVFYGAVKGRLSVSEQEKKAQQQRGDQLIAKLSQGCGPILDVAEFEAELAGVAALLVAGYAVDYRAMLGLRRFTKVTLPTYPFAKQRYWLEQNPTPKSIQNAQPAQAPVVEKAQMQPAQIHKPKAIQLVSPERISTPQMQSLKKQTLSLSESTNVEQPEIPALATPNAAIKTEPPMQTEQALSQERPRILIDLTDLGRGVFGIDINQPISIDAIADLATQLQAGLQQVSASETSRAVIVKGVHHLPQSGVDNLTLRQLVSAVTTCVLPIVLEVSSNEKQASLATLLLAGVADLSVWQSQEYDWRAQQLQIQSDTALTALLTERFGARFTQFDQAHALKLCESDKNGMHFVAKENVAQSSLALAYRLAEAPQASLTLLKQHFFAPLDAALNGAAQSPLASAGESISQQQWCDFAVQQTGQPVNLSPESVSVEGAEQALGGLMHSQNIAGIVSLTQYQNGVVEVVLEDKQQHNMLSLQMIEALVNAFDTIATMADAKVVVLTGYDQYFSLGGTKSGLQSIHRGEVKFTDSSIYNIAMQCALPVIAAIQGHGIGAGWALGMYSDFVILGSESIYISPYMGYGFTPGAGATLVFSHKYGKDLGREILFTAREYAGRELAQRSQQINVAPRQKVLAIARTLASHLAQIPLQTLTAFKAQVNQGLSSVIQQVYQLEQAMHEKTFVGNQAVLDGIESRFVDNLTTQDNSDSGAEAMTTTNVNDIATHSASPSVDANSLLEMLISTLAEQLGMDDDEIEPEQEFVELGVDSVVGVTWIRKINETYDLDVAVTKVYQYPTIEKLAKYILSLLPATNAPASIPAQPLEKHIETESVVADVATPVQPEKSVKLTLNLPESNSAPSAPIAQASAQQKIVASAEQKPVTSKQNVQESAPQVEAPVEKNAPVIAIIGMAGQFPKAKDIDTYWDNICQQRDCIEEVPLSRWDIGELYDPNPMQANKSYSKWMGSLQNADHFDPLFFAISPQEAVAMDPQQRVILQTSWHCLENAGYDPDSLSGSLTGVYVGCGPNDYGHSYSGEMNAEGLTGSSSSILTGRISYQLNLLGPCVAVDTACSSSLVALAYACDALTLHNCDMALAGGVCVMGGSSIHIMTSNAGMLSSDGRCFTFDQRANGFVPSEGVGLVCLKRLDDALRDGDRIEATIVGWGTNQDGKTNGITAPNPESQTRLQRHVYQRFNIDPRQIQLVETHGTGTKLGDPIEIEALSETFNGFASKVPSGNQKVTAIGSVKTNIGHAQAAAGIASVIKVAKAIQQKTLPPTINFSQLNEHISLDDTPFYINTERKAWDVAQGHKRHGCVSSFGFSGCNAHLVLSEHTNAIQDSPSPTGAKPGANELIVLSARTEPQLVEQVRHLHDFLISDAKGDDLALADIAYTLQVGRKAMQFRLALVVDSLTALTSQLAKCLDQAAAKKTLATGKNAFAGEAGKDKSMLDLFGNNSELKQSMQTWLQQGNFAPLAEIWVKGVNVNWQDLYQGALRKRVALPLYPFAQESYWIGADSKKSNVAQQTPHNVDLSQSDELDASIVCDSTKPLHTNESHQTQSEKTQPEFLYVQECWQDAALDSIANQPDIVTRVTASLDANALSPVHVLVLFEQVREGEKFIQTVNAQLDAISPALRDYVVIKREQISEMDEVFYQGLRSQPADVVFFLGAGKPSLNGTHTTAEKALKPIFELSRHLVAHQSHHACELYYCCSDTVINQVEGENTQAEISPYALYQQGLSGLFRAVASEVETHHFCTVTHSQSAYQQGLAYDEIAQEWLTHWLGEKGSSKKQGYSAAAQLAMVRYADETNANTSSRRQVATLCELPSEALVSEQAQSHQPILREGATYLMAGALGEVGLAVCLKLAEKYRPTLVMLSRREQDQNINAQLDKLTQAGAKVKYYAVDINDFQALSQVYASMKKDVGDIHGVWHLARQVSDARMEHKSTASFFNTIAAKTEGTLNLDAITKDEPLDFFLAFSSMAAFGIEGSCDYGYSTAFQNQFARYRNQLVSSQQRHGVSSAICWGQWSLDHYSNEQRDLLLWQMGFDFISPEHAIALSQRLLNHARSSLQDYAVLGVLAVNDKAKVRDFYQLAEPPYHAPQINAKASVDTVSQSAPPQSTSPKIVTLPRGAIREADEGNAEKSSATSATQDNEQCSALEKALQLISEPSSKDALAQLEAQLLNASPDELAALYQKLVNEE
ncbi:beta-ketoacyl synthase N-terminal-like domain-containing protein [Alteromonas sp. a30]|uniref:beta-ketoacyl synthase N-terminal-like domain-containing protein n=1 Tax=Alteromonas sp. a30 TaxID=2730917 RepID=UPI002280F4E4|nr:beta-ketoacyl synthase N-terminal-like domain-containing protein [Alteromonas sp. a30]MCY7297027.1 KR domain-containing protein [Alteromonas sp. a30]